MSVYAKCKKSDVLNAELRLKSYLKYTYKC
jgi:hypothetical protein